MANNMKQKAAQLRKTGFSYHEITNKLGLKIPKSTLSGWLKDIVLPEKSVIRLREKNLSHLKLARLKAVEVNRLKRGNYLASLRHKNEHLTVGLSDIRTAKIALIMLYVCEGSKRTQNGAVAFGNSDYRIIKLFLSLFESVYPVDRKKFRVTVQCRADQDEQELIKYWQSVTDLPFDQFYKSLVDKRTIGKPTRRADYRGVCRITYLSADALNDIMQSIDIILGR